MNSLLGYLYSKFDVPEDIATESFVYIINRSKNIRLAINKSLRAESS